MASTRNDNPYTNDQQEPSTKGILEDFSMTQVIASALAAATSVLLSSQIGIVGGIIGVAAGAGVAAIASQLYKGILSASADKIKSKVSSNDVADHADLTSRYPSARQAQQTANPQVTQRMDGRHVVACDPAAPGADKTVVSARPQTAANPYASHAAPRPRVAPAAVREEAASKRESATKRKAMIVVVVAAIAAVLLTALIITLATAGQGLGTKTSTVVVSDQAATPVTTKAASSTAAATTPASTKAATTTQETSAATTDSATTESATTASTTSQATTAASSSAASTSASTTAASSSAASSSAATATGSDSSSGKSS